MGRPRPSRSVVPRNHTYVQGQSSLLRRLHGRHVPLRQKVCRTCGALFALCPACDRGQAYGSPPCQDAGRHGSVRAAKAQYRGSPEGRLDHRDHQRAFRAHRRLRDHTSPTPRVGATLSGTDARPALPLSPPPSSATPCCRICGRLSRWVILETWRVRRAPRKGSDDHARATRQDPPTLFRRALEGQHHHHAARRAP